MMTLQSTPSSPLVPMHRSHCRETASQTAGPYVHIGLAPEAAGFDIFENNFGNVLVERPDPGRAHPHRRPRVRRHRHTGARRADRDLAGQRRRPVRAPGRPPADKAFDPHFRGWGRTGADFESGVYRFETIKPGSVAGRGSVAWRRTSMPGSSRAASTWACTPASTSATKPKPTPRLRAEPASNGKCAARPSWPSVAKLTAKWFTPSTCGCRTRRTVARKQCSSISDVVARSVSSGIEGAPVNSRRNRGLRRFA